MERTLIVAAGPLDRTRCPVRAVVPDLAQNACVRLSEASGREVPVQVVPGGVAWLLDSLPAGEVRRYRLVEEECAPSPTIELRDRPGEALDFSVGGAHFTTYNYASRWARPFFHPVIVDGRQVTRAWPMDELPGETRDHPHHKGIWVAHGDVNGVDDWSEQSGHGRIVHREFTYVSAGPVVAEVHESLGWVSASGSPVLDEARRLAVWNLPTSDRLLDVDVSLTALGQAVKFGDTKEAGLISVRVATSMDGNKGGLIENGFGGRREAETWGKTAPWCHYSGQVGGPGRDEVMGIGVFDHPANPRYPSNWHVRDYGLMTANPFGYHDFFPERGRDGSLTLPAGETMTFRYRVYLHRGDAAAGEVEARFADYAFPPAAGAE